VLGGVVRFSGGTRVGEENEMASDKQIAANRRNAAKSTGPKTRKGKRLARMNALRHGLRAEQVMIPGEDPAELERLVQEIERYYQPVGPIEESLVQRIAFCFWRLRRLTLIETGMMHSEWHISEMEAATELLEIDEKRRQEEIMFPDLSTSYSEADPDPEMERIREEKRKAHDALGEALSQPVSCFANAYLRAAEDLEKVTRYETTIERQLRNAMRDLERVQDRRKSEDADRAMVIEDTAVNQNESENVAGKNRTRVRL